MARRAELSASPPCAGPWWGSDVTSQFFWKISPLGFGCHPRGGAAPCRPPALRHGAVTSYPRCGALPAAGAGLGLSRIVRLPPGASGRRVCHGVLVNDNALMDPWCTYVETQTHRSVKVGKDFQDHPVQLSTPKPQTTSPDSSRTLLGMVTPPPPWETNSQCLTTQRLKKFSSNI